jgi:hypothetical protein
MPKPRKPRIIRPPAAPPVVAAIPVAQEPTPVAKRGILDLIADLFRKQDAATTLKEGLFVGGIIVAMFAGGFFQSCHTDSVIATQNAKIDTVAAAQKIQIDSTSKIQTDTLRRQYRNWRVKDSILAAERFDSLVHLITHKKR